MALIDISLSFSTISIGVRRWPMSLSASRLRPAISAASPTTTAIRSPLRRMSRAAARPSAIERPVPACPPSKTSCSLSRTAREAADAIDLAEGAESLEPAREELVGVGLVACVPDDPILRRVEQAVERDRDLDDAERRAEVAARLGDGRDDRVPDLLRQVLELGLGQPLEVGRAGQPGEDLDRTLVRAHSCGGPARRLRSGSM